MCTTKGFESKILLDPAKMAQPWLCEGSVATRGVA